jgi:c(7)-type cytochrome triheme protein
MPYKSRILIILPVSLLLGAVITSFQAGDALGQGAEFFNLPPHPEQHEYGDILINRTSEKNNVKAVYFSHWSHRIKYTCRVCHFELEFEFRVNTTEITEEDNRNGLFCGACHDDDKAFGHIAKADCEKCHTGKIAPDRKRFKRIYRKLPRSRFGNGINWARTPKITHPYYSIFAREKPMRFKKMLELKAEWAGIPPAIFPHKPHVIWLDCSNCHPDVFNIKKKTTKHFRMEYILDKKFCGVCHLNVAFPLDNCKRCHPKIRNKQ